MPQIPLIHLFTIIPLLLLFLCEVGDPPSREFSRTGLLPESGTHWADAATVSKVLVKQLKITLKLFITILPPPLKTLFIAPKRCFYFWLQAKNLSHRHCSARIHNSAPGVDSTGCTPDDRHRNYARLPHKSLFQVPLCLYESLHLLCTQTLFALTFRVFRLVSFPPPEFSAVLLLLKLSLVQNKFHIDFETYKTLNQWLSLPPSSEMNLYANYKDKGTNPKRKKLQTDCSLYPPLLVGSITRIYYTVYSN